MSGNTALRVMDDFDYLVSFLPPEWESKAKDLGALRRCRKVDDARTLLRVLLIHLAEGCSLRETSARIRQGGIADLTDVAIMDRLRQAGEWFCWMNEQLISMWIPRQPSSVFGSQWNVRLVDGTRVKEPGPTGSSWCVHYSIDLPSLRCREMHVTDKHGNAEAFWRFAVQKGDLLVGDRAYGTPRSISYVLENGGGTVARFGWNHLPLWETTTSRFDLFGHLRELHGTKLGDWDVTVKHKGRSWPGRVCALRKSRQATEMALKKVRRGAQKHGSKTQPETMEAAKYLFVFTSIDRRALPVSKVLEMYRGRWQIELVFKRLKSLMGFGHLRKRDPDAADAWIHGKLLVALLIETLITQGEALFPWGYPIEASPEPMSLA